MSATLEQNFRDAWRDADGNTYSARVARRSLEASAEQSADLAVVLFELKNRFQSELDLHLDGSTVKGHSTDAADFADLVRGIADAVKEITKQAMGRQRMSPGLLVSAPMPGSVRVILSAASPAEPDGHIEAARAETHDSNSLRVVATLLASATGSETDGSNILDGLVTAIPFKARAGIRRAAKAVSASNWVVEGELRRPNADAVALHIDRESAQNLLSVLDVKDVETGQQSLAGKVDGQRRSMGTMWFVPNGLPPIEAAVIDRGLLEEVASLGASGVDVNAEFSVVTQFAPGARTSARQSYVLTAIREIQRTSTAMEL